MSNTVGAATATSTNKRETVTRPRSTFTAWDWGVLFGCVLIVPLIYFPDLLHNLPVAGNVDERTSLAILLRFHQGSLDPQFFMYPTLYYYLTYLFVAPFTPAHFLLAGRALNLCLVGLTAFLSYAFCKRHLHSSVAGLIAAPCVITSTTITDSGSYLCTDVLLAAATMGSLYYLVAYFAEGGSRPWLLGMVLLGAAVGSKYTAFILYIAYYGAELTMALRKPNLENHVPVSVSDDRFSRATMLCFLAACASAAMLASYFFPIEATLHFVSANRSNANLRDPREYLAFFSHLRRMLAEAAGFCVALALAVRFSRRVYDVLSRKTPYLGLAVVVGVSYISTPYSLIDIKRFIYDLGALARSNIVVAGQHAEWSQYVTWLFNRENVILVALGVAGIALAPRRRLDLLVVGLYLALYGIVIGSAHVGYPRYLTPLLPLLYCGSGIALVRLWEWRPSVASFPWTRAIAVILAITVSIQLSLHIARRRALSADSDAFLASYQAARLNFTGADLYAGYAPSVELEAAGVKTRQVSWANLAGRPLASQMNCGDLLILDRKEAEQHAVYAEADRTVTMLLDDTRGDGQEVVRRTNCR